MRFGWMMVMSTRSRKVGQTFAVTRETHPPDRSQGAAKTAPSSRSRRFRIFLEGT